MRRAQTILAGLLIAALAILAPHSQTVAAMDCVEGSGVPRQETRELKAFTRLTVSGVFDVHVEVGPSQRVSIRGDDNILPHIVTEVRDGTLSVGSNRSLCIKTDLRLDITVPELSGFESGGTVSFDARGIHGRRFDLKLDGTGNAKLAGECERFDAAVLGTSDIQALDLSAQRVSIRLEGTGNASVYAGHRLDAVISGVGNITYAGNPSQINPHITGLGELIPR